MAVGTTLGLEASQEVLERLCADVMANGGATRAMVLGPEDEHAGSTRITAPTRAHLDAVMAYLLTHAEWGPVMRTACY